MSGAAEKSYRIALVVLLLLVMANALAAGLHTVSDFDMGWHLATGRWVVQHHAIPSTDVLSYTTAGARWIYSPFAGVLLYWIYGADGYAGLSIFCALACMATVAYLVRRRDLASLVLAMFAINPIAFRAEPRADLFSTIFLAIFLGELWAFQHGSSKRLWVLPLTMLFWVNFHPGFILGLVVIGAYLLLEAGELLFADRRGDALQRLRTAGPWLAGTVAATLINPWGAKLYSASLSLAGLHRPLAGVSTPADAEEFHSYGLSFHLIEELADFRYHENGFLWLMFAAALVMVLALWRKQFGVVLIQGAALYLSLQHVRYIGLFCVATTILGATLLGEACSTEAWSSDPQKDLAKSKPLLRVPPALALGFVCVIGAITLLHIADFISDRTHVVYSTASRFGLGEANWFPERAASFIRRERLPGNIFEEYELGGFAAWRLGPEYLDFIDGRNVNPAVLAEERKLLRQSPDLPLWQEAADKWGINVLLIPEAEPEAEATVRQDVTRYCQSNNWRPIYMDEVSLVLLRNVPTNRPWIDRLQIDCGTQELAPPQSASRKDLYDFFVNAGGMLSALHRDHESEAALLRAAALYPNDPNARWMLGQLYLSHQMYDRAESEYRASLALNETEGPWVELGVLYLQEQRLPEAEHAFSRAVQLSDDPFPLYRQIALVDLSLRRPEAVLRALDGVTNSSPYRNGAESQAPQLYAEIADGRAEAHRMLSQLPEAIAFEEEAVRLNPGVAERWNKLADLREANGQIELSRQARQRALELAAGQR
jgi:tetratricopeptide (TPR) repeat protein